MLRQDKNVNSKRTIDLTFYRNQKDEKQIKDGRVGSSLFYVLKIRVSRPK